MCTLSHPAHTEDAAVEGSVAPLVRRPQVVQVIIAAINDADDVIEGWIQVVSRTHGRISGQFADLADVIVPLKHSLSVLVMGGSPPLRAGRNGLSDALSRLALHAPAIILAA